MPTGDADRDDAVYHNRVRAELTEHDDGLHDHRRDHVRNNRSYREYNDNSALSPSERDAARYYGERFGNDLRAGRATAADIIRVEREYGDYAWQCRVFFGDDATTWPDFVPSYLRELEDHDALN
jgi:hypothetical protein